MLSATIMLFLSGTAQAQADTSRRRPTSRIATPAPVLAADSAAEIEMVHLPEADQPLERMPAAQRRSMLDTLESQRRIWEERRPQQYIIRVFELNGCAEVRTGPYAGGELLRDRLVVRDTRRLRREPAPTPATYAQRCLLAWRVDDLFADVARVLADPNAAISKIEYDAAYGFPRMYWADRGGHHRSAGVLVESFAPAP
ncbi:MAG: hypothetical protein ACYC2G_14580 [Gemmatimonadaceae bacterium]